MRTIRNLIVLLLMLVVCGVSACGESPNGVPQINPFIAEPTATPLPEPTATPLPEPGLGVPQVSGAWQISLDAVRTADSTQMGSGVNQITFTPNEGYAFLIIEMTIRYLNPTQAMKLTTENIAILDANKSIHTANGGGWGASEVCAGCQITLSKDVGASETSASSLIFGGGRMTMNFMRISNDQPLKFLFVVKSEELNQEWQLQFQDFPLIPFKLGDVAAYPFATEVTAQDSPLPKECQGEGMKAAETTAGLMYQTWEADTLVSHLVSSSGQSPQDLCAGFAYSQIKSAPDGGLLLKSGPARGWSNLYLLEPDGSVKSLVRNALSVAGDFVPGSKYVVISVKSIGKEGQELYLYDRAQGTMKQLYAGEFLNYRFFDNGYLLVNGRLSNSSGWFEAFGPAGADPLPELALPEGASRADLTQDGEHLLYTSFESGASHLYLSNLDGSEKKELLSGQDIPYGNKVLSPDGALMLYQGKGQAESTQQAFLYEIATGVSQGFTADSNSLAYGFSPDGKWVTAVSTINREKDDPVKTKKQTLYIFSIEKKQVVKEIQGEIVNHFFSPKSDFIAYTLKNEDGTISMFVIHLTDLSEQSLGAGLLTGWSVGQ